jgi:hypothetical protein
MQLYFGSIYEKNPERYGIKPAAGYRPSYISAGDQYETESMSQAEIKRVRNLWTLANEQIERDVYYKQRIFDVIQFLVENEDDLHEEPAFCHLGALASNAIEEFDLMIHFLEAGEKIQANSNILKDTVSGITIFKETDQPSGPADRVIFDSRSWIDNIPFTGISGKYWDVLLGRGLLLPAFEQGLIGVREGEDAKFFFVFPEDYYQEELRSKEVQIHAKLHKVFKVIQVETLEQLKDLRIRNRFGFADLDLLKEQNEILYYLALRDFDLQELLKKPGHFLNLVQRLAKLGKRADIDRMAGLLDRKPAALNALADTLAGTGKFSWALGYYYAVSESIRSSVLKRVHCLLGMKKPDEAMKLLETVPETPDLQFQEMLLECLKAVRPESDRIPSLEHNVLELKIKASLDRESMRGGSSPSPLVHGLDADRSAGV